MQWGWICFGIGIALMFVALSTIFIYGPVLFAAFVLSIIGMAKGRIGNGLALLITTLIIPPLFWIGLFAVRFNQISTDQKRTKWAQLNDIKFADVEGYIDGNYMYFKGKVRNGGSNTVDYVKVEVSWKDEAGTVLDTGWTYAVGGEGLRPGAAKSFDIMTPTDRRMKKFSYRVVYD